MAGVNLFANIFLGIASLKEINVQGNGNTIADGDVTPTASDFTDFGNIPTGNNLVRTYTIQNNGTANLRK